METLGCRATRQTPPVQEVWFWRNNTIETFFLTGESFDAIETSRLFPDFEPASLCAYLEEPTAEVLAA